MRTNEKEVTDILYCYILEFQMKRIIYSNDKREFRALRLFFNNVHLFNVKNREIRKHNGNNSNGKKINV